MTGNYKYIIIGAGPSGSAAASLLASGGEEICIIEKKKFPRDVLCGEFLSAEVIRFLNQQGLREKFLKLNPQRIKSFRLINPNGKELYSDLNFEAFALKRSAFDKLTLDNAVDKGAVLMSPAEVNDLSTDGDKLKVCIKNGSEAKTLTTETIIAAYGRNSPLDKKSGRFFCSIRTGISGVKFHLNKSFFNDPPEDEIRIYTGDGIYCGINPVNDNDFTVCFLAGKKRNPNTPKEHINFLQKNNKRFADLFISEFDKFLPEIKFYGTSHLFFGEREKYLKGVYYTGDAAGIIAPLAGDGIGMAFQCAQVLTDHLNNQKAPSEYGSDWKKLFASRLRTAKLIQNLLLSSSSRDLAVVAAGLFPSVLGYLIRQTRSSK